MHSRRESLQQHGGAENVVVLVRLHNVRGRAALRPAIARDVPVDVEQLESLPALSVPSNSFQQSHRRSTCLPMTFASSVVTAPTTPTRTRRWSSSKACPPCPCLQTPSINPIEGRPAGAQTEKVSSVLRVPVAAGGPLPITQWAGLSHSVLPPSLSGLRNAHSVLCFH